MMNKIGYMVVIHKNEQDIIYIICMTLVYTQNLLEVCRSGHAKEILIILLTVEVFSFPFLLEYTYNCTEFSIRIVTKSIYVKFK